MYDEAVRALETWAVNHGAGTCTLTKPYRNKPSHTLLIAFFAHSNLLSFQDRLSRPMYGHAGLCMAM